LSENQRGLKSLLLKATEDEKLRKSFLKDPDKVAKEHGVTLTATELERLANAGRYIEAVATLKIPIPINGYPIEMVVQNWQIEELTSLINIYAPIYGPWEGTLAPTPILLPKEASTALTPIQMPKTPMAGPMYTINLGAAGSIYVYASGKFKFIPHGYPAEIIGALAKHAAQISKE
jgi:hypothetical protein